MGLTNLNRLGLCLLVACAFASASPAAGITRLLKKGKTTSRPEFADFQGKAHLRIPSGFTYITGDELVAFNKDTDNVTEPGEIGMFIPEGGEWFATILVPPDDPL